MANTDATNAQGQSMNDARRQARESSCSGCQKQGTRKALEVNNGGPNQGRLFLKCSSCGHFAWFSPPSTIDADVANLQAPTGPGSAAARLAGPARQDLAPGGPLV